MLIFVRLSKQRWRQIQERQESRAGASGGRGVFTPPPPSIIGHLFEDLQWRIGV